MKTAVDWLRFRTRSNPFQILEAIRPAFGSVGELLVLGDSVRGVDGWLWRRPLRVVDITVGFVDYGGDHMREWVRADFTGEGCGWVQDWAVMESLPSVLPDADLRRVDLALTTADGSVTHERVLAAHDAGEFCSGGRNPYRKTIDSNEPGAGRTIYVGKRTQGKFLRAYEKGLQLLKDVAVDLRAHIDEMTVDGFGKVDPRKLYRVEVEFKAVDKVLPWPMLFSERDSHFAGAYPFLASLLPSCPPLRISCLPEAKAKQALQTQAHYCRTAYGGVIRALYEVLRDADAVLDLVMADKPSERLVSAGVLTVDHE